MGSLLAAAAIAFGNNCGAATCDGKQHPPSDVAPVPPHSITELVNSLDDYGAAPLALGAAARARGFGPDAVAVLRHGERRVFRWLPD